MYDGVNAAVIARKFPNADLVAGYTTGKYAWSVADWNRFPQRKHISITVNAETAWADVLDVETGDATPADAKRWIALQKEHGYLRPTVYCLLRVIPAVREAVAPYALGRDYDIWAVDTHSGTPHEVTAPGSPPLICAATQYHQGKKFPPWDNYDASVVYDPGWPHRPNL